MDVPDLKSRPLPSQTPWAESRQTTLVGNFRKRVRLIHELGELAGTEKLLQGSRDRFVVNQFLRHQSFNILQTHLFLDGPFHSNQPHTKMIFYKLPYRPHAAIAKMVDIIDRAISILQFHKATNDFKDIFFAQRPLLQGHIDFQSVI